MSSRCLVCKRFCKHEQSVEISIVERRDEEERCDFGDTTEPSRSPS
jgi:hypothetical protein